MTDTDELDTIGAIYHELGHLIGYILSNYNDSTNLGSVSEFNVGSSKNCVSPSENFYHFLNGLANHDDRNRITENTKRIERTAAWIIEVILGCMAQTVYEDTDFEDCYGPQDRKLGKFDFGNINGVHVVNEFQYNKDVFDELVLKIRQLIVNYNLIEKIKFIVDDILKKLIESNSKQLYYYGEELEILIQQVKSLIDNDIVDSYMEIVENYCKDVKKLKADNYHDKLWTK